MSNRNKANTRKIAYYAGLLLIAAGFLLFASVFITSMRNFGNFSNLDIQVKSGSTRAIAGMGLILVGMILRVLGARRATSPGKERDAEL